MRESDDIYMQNPKAKSLDGFIDAINIFSKYLEKGLAETYFFQGEHDIIYANMGINEIPEDSYDGQELTKLGWHVEEEHWAYFT